MNQQPNIIDYAIPITLFVMVVAGLLATLIANIQHRMRQRQQTPAHGSLPAQQSSRGALPLPVDSTGAARNAPSNVQMSASRWLHLLNERPDDVPHVLILGPTGSGKTTFAAALLGRRPDLVLVLTPKVKPADWRGSPVVSLDDTGSYAPIARAIAAIEAERRRRLVLLRQGTALDDLTIVLDEAPDLADEVPGTGDLIRKLGQMGRDLRMRMLVLSTSQNVKDLGLEGRGRARENYAWVRLRPALNSQRTATLTWGERESDLDLALVRAMAQHANLSDRGWTPPPESPQSIPNRDPEEMRNDMTMPRLIRHETGRNETSEMVVSGVATGEMVRNALQDETDQIAGMALAVARMVAVGKCSETEGIKIVFGVNPGSSAAYQAARAALKQAQEKLIHEL